MQSQSINKELAEIGEQLIAARRLTSLPDYDPDDKLRQEYEHTFFSKDDEQTQKKIRERVGIEYARRYLARHYQALRDSICPHKERYLARLGSDQTQLAASVADVCAAAMFGVPPAILTTLILKVGLRKFCAENPFKDDPKTGTDTKSD